MGKRFRRFSLALAGFAMALAAGVAIGTSAGRTPKETRATASTSGTFFKVKTADGLVAGDQVIFVNTAGNNALQRISTTSTKYGLLTGVAVSGNSVTLESANVEVFNVETGYDGNGFSFLGTSNVSGYLYWDSGNSLDCNANKTENTSWSLSANDGLITIKNNKDSTRLLRFNSDRFACYTTNTGTVAQIYKKVSVEAASFMSATVTAKPGAADWSISDLFVAGTLNGASNSEITDYVDLSAADGFDVPSDPSDSVTVQFNVARKSGVGGSEPLDTLTINNAKVSSDTFVSYSLVTSVGSVNSHTLYALGTADKAKFGKNRVYNKYISTNTANSDIGLFRLEPVLGGGYYLRFATGNSFPYQLGNYVNNPQEQELSGDAAGATVWTPTETGDGKVFLLNQGNRFLGYTASTIKAFTEAEAGNNKYVLYSYETDRLSGVALVGYETSFEVGDEFSFGGTISPTYTKTRTVRHLSTNKADKFEIKNSDSLSFNDISEGDVLSYANDGATVRVHYSDEWGASAFASYDISVAYAPIESLSLNTGSSLSLSTDGSRDFDATPSPLNANPNVTWTASSATFVKDTDYTLNSSGLLTMTTDHSGSLTVTATSDADGSVSSSCVVTITADPILSLDITSLTDKYTGDVDQVLTATASNFVGAITYTWTTTNADVATITQDPTYANKATVHYAGGGDATIRVRAVGATTGDLTSDCTVSVTASAVTAITLDKSSGTLYLGSATHATDTLSVSSYTLVGHATEGVTWETSNADVATVSNGVVTAAGVGSATITARSTYTTSTTASYAVEVFPEAGDTLSWTGRGTFACFEGTTIAEAVDTSKWRFNGAYQSGDTFSDLTVSSVGAGENDIHIGLYSAANPSEESTPLSLDYAFKSSDHGKYVVACYMGAFSQTNTKVAIQLNSILKTETDTLDNFWTGAVINAAGASGTGDKAGATNGAFTVSSDKGYFEESPYKVYQDGTLTIKSTNLIKTVQFTFNGDNTGDIPTGVITVNARTDQWTTSGQAQITGIQIVYQEEYANVNANAQAAVIAFATFVNDTMAVEGVCGTNGNYGTHTSVALNAAWTAVKGEYNTLFGAGTSLNASDLLAAKNMLGYATAKWNSNPDCLQRAMKTYEFVVANYSAELDSGYNFMDGVRAVNLAARVNSMSYAGETMNPALLVVILAGLSAAVVGVYFFLKRRQERE